MIDQISSKVFNEGLLTMAATTQPLALLQLRFDPRVAPTPDSMIGLLLTIDVVELKIFR